MIEAIVIPRSYISNWEIIDVKKLHFFSGRKTVSLGILIGFGLGKIDLLLHIGCVSVSDES